MSLLWTTGRTGITTFVFSPFPPFLNSPAASMAAFWLGCFGHPQPHTPRSLNVVEISRCVNEDSLMRQGIWFWADDPDAFLAAITAATPVARPS
jgi:hypothetical protein